MLNFFFHPGERDLVRFSSGTDAGTARARTARHLGGCGRCRNAVTEIRRVAALARSAPAPAPSAGLLDRILAERDRGGRALLPAAPAQRQRTRPALRIVAVAAAVAGLALASALLRESSGPGNEESPAFAADPLLHGFGVLPSPAYGSEPPGRTAPAVPPLRFDGTRIRPGRWSYQLGVARGGRLDAPAERGTVTAEAVVFEGRAAWRLTNAWHGHRNDRPEVVLMDRRTLEPLFRTAHQVGASRYTVVQRFRGDSVVGTMTGRGRVRRIARSLGVARPRVAGEGAPVLVLQAAELRPGTAGHFLLIGWGAMAGDLHYPVEVRVTGAEPVRVPAGSFDAWRLEVRSADKVQTLWVRRADGLPLRARERLGPETFKEMTLIRETVPPRP